MTRPTRVFIDATALRHNLNYIKRQAPKSQVITMVKANAYGCGLSSVIPTLDGHVAAFGVASLEEALAVRRLGSTSPCILFQGVFSPDELIIAAKNNFALVIHQARQLEWLIDAKLDRPISVWVKVNTGMHRLGFAPEEIYDVLLTLSRCAYVQKPIGLMTHFACADIDKSPRNDDQLKCFNALKLPELEIKVSMANSAAILNLPQSHADFVRPGIMLYGVSPFAEMSGRDLGLKPVMHFYSAISAIHHYPANASIGYGGTWQSTLPSTIGVVPVGYGDGYPRHIKAGSSVWINGQLAPIVGRVSMDMLTIDLTAIDGVSIGNKVELWGAHLPVEHIALASDTIAYELICQVSPRVRDIHPI